MVPRTARALRLGERDPEQLACRLRRRLRVDARPGARPLLPAQLRTRATRPRLVEPGGARGVRAHSSLLVRPRGRGLPNRRRQRARQGPGASRQPSGERERRSLVATSWLHAALQRQPARGARDLPGVACAGRRLRPSAGTRRRSLGVGLRQVGGVLGNRSGRAEHGLQLPAARRAVRGRRTP